MNATNSPWTDVAGGALHYPSAFLSFFHMPFLIRPKNPFRCFTLEVKGSIFLIVDSCGWSTCKNSSLPSFFIPAFIHDTCLQSQQRSKIPSLSFHIACSLVVMS
ncbi:hypothetical protein BDW68DRAFT_91760 [Aspergillus falconensis]